MWTEKIVLGMGLVLCIHQYRKSSEMLAEEPSPSGLFVLGLFQELELRGKLVQKSWETLPPATFAQITPSPKMDEQNEAVQATFC